MNFKRYHESKNLLSEKYENRSINGVGAFTIDNNYDLWIGEVIAGQTYAISNMDYVYGFFATKPMPNTGATYDGSRGYEISGTAVVTIPSGCTWIAVRVLHNADNAMCNTGSTPLPYEPYSSEVWHDIPYYIHNTSTDTLTTLPADVYADGQSATVGLKGQMVQSSTPTPQNPIQPSECGDLETTGAHAGQYKIPISSASTTTPVYLGEVETTRKIKKLVLTGQEEFVAVGDGNIFRLSFEGYLRNSNNIIVCTHYVGEAPVEGYAQLHNLCVAFLLSSSESNFLYIRDDNYTSASTFKTYLQQQYANGTPVVVWYVLSTPTAGIVNEPLRKIGDYADSVSGITIPTISGKDSFDVLTTLKPSEVQLTYHGWHPKPGKEYSGGSWS